jgi:hypothetical protein
MNRTYPYIVTTTKGEIHIIARTRTDAILTAQELTQGKVLCATREGDW